MATCGPAADTCLDKLLWLEDPNERYDDAGTGNAPKGFVDVVASKPCLVVSSNRYITGKECMDFAEWRTPMCEDVCDPWTAWSAWSACSANCGGGQRVRTRHRAVHDVTKTQTLDCNTQACAGEGRKLNQI